MHPSKILIGIKKGKNIPYGIQNKKYNKIFDNSRKFQFNNQKIYKAFLSKC